MLLDMFRASLCSSSGGKLYICRFWYRHTGNSKWSYVTKMWSNILYIYIKFHLNPASGGRAETCARTEGQVDRERKTE